MAGRPVEALALLAIGVRSLSMAPGAIGPVKAMIRSLDLDEAIADGPCPLQTTPTIASGQQTDRKLGVTSEIDGQSRADYWR